MKKLPYILFFAVTFFTAINSNAQPGVFQPGDYRDGIYDKENSVNTRFSQFTSDSRK